MYGSENELERGGLHLTTQRDSCYKGISRTRGGSSSIDLSPEREQGDSEYSLGGWRAVYRSGKLLESRPLNASLSGCAREEGRVL